MKKCNRLQLITITITITPCLLIRPLFEYACELWDNCGIGNSQKLEQLQLEAARIVTGLSIFLPKLKFYIERQVGNYYLGDGREGNFNFFII